MQIHSITSRHRRDIRGKLRCQHCDHQQNFTGYDDTYYHREVVPTIPCGSCGKVAPHGAVKTSPHHPDHAQL